MRSGTSWPCALTGCAFVVAACAHLSPNPSTPLSPNATPQSDRQVSLAVQAVIAQTTIEAMSVEVSGPGIRIPVVFNLATEGGVATGVVVVPAGSDRTFTVRGFNAARREVYRGTKTASVVSGESVALSMRLSSALDRGPGTSQLFPCPPNICDPEVAIATYTITISPKTLLVSVGDKVQFNAVVTDTNGRVVAGHLTWSSWNARIASVNNSGLATARAGGTTSIVVSYQVESIVTIAAAATLTVISGPLPVASVQVAPGSVTIAGGVTTQLTATVKDANGGLLAGRLVTWATANNNVAIVNGSGQVTGFQTGTTQITATSESKSGFAYATVLPWQTISAGNRHTCALAANGAAYCWGNNSAGQLGNGTTTSSKTPIPVSGGIIFLSISAGADVTCGLAAGSRGLFTTGTAYCWGDNSFGQLGAHLASPASTVPVQVDSGYFAVWAVSAGDAHACGIFSNPADPGPSAFCWGRNSSGQLGDGSTTNRDAPVFVPVSGNTLIAVDAGGTSSCGISPLWPALPPTPPTPQRAYCWGSNSFGELGNGSTTSSSTAVLVGGSSGLSFSSVAAGSVIGAKEHNCALDSFGQAYCWGSNRAGALGDASLRDSANPVPVAILYIYKMLTAGGEHTCGIRGTKAYCWGDNSSGQLGDGTTTMHYTPVAVQGLLANSGLALIDSGTRHTCGITVVGGSAVCWGENSDGQLGNNSLTSTRVPVLVLGLIGP